MLFRRDAGATRAVNLFRLTALKLFPVPTQWRHTRFFTVIAAEWRNLCVFARKTRILATASAAVWWQY
jgi:hypothetical protein